MMGQIFRIFRKDVRHFWIEILASLLALSAYIWRVLYHWAHPRVLFDLPAFLDSSLATLGPISWCLLIVRVIQDESLVGDRQFWVTRPYEWPKLLGAKALFVLVFVNVPLFAANAIFLWRSGFSPTRYFPGLLWVQLLFLAILVLPAASVSVVTSTVVQLVLWTLGIAVYIVGAASLSSLIPDSHIPTSASDASDLIAPCVLAVVCLAIILWQYKQRRAWIPRAVIVVLAVALSVGAVLPSATEMEVTRAYPVLAAGEQPPFQLTAVSPKPPADDELQVGNKNVMLWIPVEFSGVASDSLVVVAGTRLTIRTRTGSQLTSKWVNDNRSVWPGEQSWSVSAEIDGKFYEQSRFIPSDMLVTLAFTEYRETNTRQIVAAAGEFPVSGIGICWISLPRTDIECRSPLKASPALARYETSMSTCPSNSSHADIRPISYAAYLDDNSIEPTLIPTQNSDLHFGPEPRDAETPAPGVCPGTTISLSTPVVARRASTKLEIDNADLRDYVSPPIRFRYSSLAPDAR